MPPIFLAEQRERLLLSKEMFRLFPSAPESKVIAPFGKPPVAKKLIKCGKPCGNSLGLSQVLGRAETGQAISPQALFFKSCNDKAVPSAANRIAALTDDFHLDFRFSLFFLSFSTFF